MKYIEENGIKELVRRMFFWTKKTWIGTAAEWAALTDVQKNRYDIAHITDDAGLGVEVVDTVEHGNMNPVTSNAVAVGRDLDWSNAVTLYNDTAVGVHPQITIGEGQYGFVFLTYSLTGTQGYGTISLNGQFIAQIVYSQKASDQGIFPVQPGDVIDVDNTTFTNNTPLQRCEIRFIPYKS